MKKACFLHKMHFLIYCYKMLQLLNKLDLVINSYFSVLDDMIYLS